MFGRLAARKGAATLAVGGALFAGGQATTQIALSTYEKEPASAGRCLGPDIRCDETPPDNKIPELLFGAGLITLGISVGPIALGIYKLRTSSNE